MTVTVLDALTASSADTWPASFPVSAGSNRLAFIITVVRGDDSALPGSVSLGGVPMTSVARADAAGRDMSVEAWVLNESEIASMSGDAVSIASTTTSGNMAYTLSVQNAAQNITKTNSVVGFVNGNEAQSLPLSRSNEGLTVACVSLGFASNPTFSSANPEVTLIGSLTGARGKAGLQQETTTNTSNFTWTPSSSRDQAVVIFSVDPFGGPSPSITAPASISPGETIAFTCSFTPTAVTASDGTSTLTLSNIVNTSGENYTAVIPALPSVGNSLQYTTFGAVTLSATDGVDTAEDTTVLAASEGQTVTILAATFSTGELSYLYNFGGTPATGDQFIEGSAQLALDANGGYVADTDGTYPITGIDATDGVAQSYNLILGDTPVDPPVSVGRITRRNLTSRAMTRRSLTARP